LYSPRSIAIDSAGNAWIANEDYDRVGHTGSISKFSSAGTALSPPTGYTGGGLLNPVSIAIDGSGNVWTANLGSVSEFSGAGAALSPSFGYGYAEGFFDSPQSIAIDGSGNAWVANDGNYSVSELIGVAAPVITPICAGLPATPTVDGSSKLGTRP
jgi:secreted PhoX family phosphatase